MATRDAIALAGGPSYAVELGRLDSLSSTASSVGGRLPAPFFNLDQLTAVFAANGLSQADMIALSAGHTVGLAHCRTFSSRISGTTPDPTMNRSYAAQLRAQCPANVDPRIAVSMDPVTPVAFDNQYFKNLQSGMGLLSSDQVLYTDPRSRPTVDAWAQSSTAFNRAFVSAMTKLGRVGVKTGTQGNIRRNCAVLN
uniref:Plant heme peroxidase family profile domain-containing protein n=1 Tax=Arundo donax TaxID=35708 RepID=A0A0A9BWJ9_ARUDO